MVQIKSKATHECKFSTLLQLFIVIYSAAFIQQKCQKIILTSSNEKGQGHRRISTASHSFFSMSSETNAASRSGGETRLHWTSSASSGRRSTVWVVKKQRGSANLREISMCQDGLRLQWPERSEKWQKETRRSDQTHRECISSGMKPTAAQVSDVCLYLKISVFFQARSSQAVDGNGSDLGFTISADSNRRHFLL